MKDINKKEEILFHEWSKSLGVTLDEFVSDGLLFHDGLMFDGANWIRTKSGNNTENWISSHRRLLIITRDQPSEDGDIWDVRGETGLSPDGESLKQIKMFQCLIPWGYAALYFDNEYNGICPNNDVSKLEFWRTAPIARINSGKIAGNRVSNGGCPRNKVIEYLETSKSFIIEQIKLYDANVIMCCTGYDSMSNPVIDFLKDNYLPDLNKVSNYLWYSKLSKKIVLDTYHFSNPNMWSKDAISEETIKIRDSILNAMKEGACLEL